MPVFRSSGLRKGQIWLSSKFTNEASFLDQSSPWAMAQLLFPLHISGTL